MEYGVIAYEKRKKLNKNLKYGSICISLTYPTIMLIKDDKNVDGR